MICFQGALIGKAKDKADALKMLQAFVGHKQQIMGMAVIGRYQGEEFKK